MKTKRYISAGLELVRLPDGLELAFCPTGKGGGVDNSCSAKGGGGGGRYGVLLAEAAEARLEAKRAKLKEMQEAKRAKLKEMQADEAKALRVLRKDPQNQQLREAYNKFSRERAKYMRELRKEGAIEPAKAAAKKAGKNSSKMLKPVGTGPALGASPHKLDDTSFAKSTINDGSLKQFQNNNVSTVYQATLSDGTKVAYKPNTGEPSPGLCQAYGVKSGTIAEREAATYELDAVLGFGVVPPTRLIDGPEGPGSAQQWVDNAECFADVAFYGPGSMSSNEWMKQESESLAHLQVIDYLTGNGDRHGNNYMVMDKGKGKAFAIDNGFAFSSKGNKPGKSNAAVRVISSWSSYTGSFDPPKSVVTGMKNLIDNKDVFHKRMRTKYPGISASNLNHFWARAEKLNSTLQGQFPGGWADVVTHRR